MRLLKRNTTRFEYLPYMGLESGKDENGFYTGTPTPVYGEATEYTGNISAPSGAAIQSFDGLEIRYSHVLLMDDPTVDIRETGKIRHNGQMFTITAVRKSMNVLSVALLADTVDNGDQTIYDDEDEEEEG